MRGELIDIPLDTANHMLYMSYSLNSLKGYI